MYLTETDDFLNDIVTMRGVTMIPEHVHQQNGGVYIDLKLADQSVRILNSFQKALGGIIDPVADDKFHCTLIYSKKSGKNDLVVYDDAVYKSETRGLDIFGSGDDDDAWLVVKLESMDLILRHNFLMKKNRLSSKFSSYSPHITIGKLDMTYMKRNNITLNNLLYSISKFSQYNIMDTTIHFNSEKYSKIDKSYNEKLSASTE
jgi:2'-5' RNA ligase